MEVHHKPKPFHGWREFLKEYGIIVLGVLTALAAEQTVEWLHWRAQVDEGRTAIRREMQDAVTDMAKRLDLGPCVVRRTRELQALADSYDQGRPLTPKGTMGRIIPYWPYNEVWVTFRGSAAAMHMPVDDQLDFARFYSVLSIIRSTDEVDRDVWRELQDFNRPGKLDDRALRRLKGLTAQARQMNASLALLSSSAIENARRLGVAPRPRPARPSDLTDSLCQPFL